MTQRFPRTGGNHFSADLKFMRKIEVHVCKPTHMWGSRGNEEQIAPEIHNTISIIPLFIGFCESIRFPFPTPGFDKSD